jgi:phosphoenolpyruvate synthase/pyruvate phosphate dikinase
MLINLDNKTIPEKIGNKAKYLMAMLSNGFNVPNGFVLDSDTYDEIVSFNNKEEQIVDIIAGINEDNIKSTSEKLSGLFEGFELPQTIIDAVCVKMKEGIKYAVRSSGIKEDLESFSFAGQYLTFLNTEGLDNVKNAIINCYKSMYSETILSYLVNNSLGTEHLEMAVIVQEMVNSDKSGIAFTVNPLTGDDKEIVVEIAEGLGDNIVSGKVVPERYFYNWFNDEYQYEQTNKLLTPVELDALMKTLLDIQVYFGYPCDVEFAFEKGRLYILQSRAITKIMYSKIKDQWSTADFKDGGVSATVCTPFMWSLYEYIWDTMLKKYMLDSKILEENKLRKLSEMFYGRPYWNMSMVKSAMATVPGYKEREFDSEFGVKITYTGDGNTTKITPKSIYKIIRMAIKQKELLSHHLDHVEEYKQELLGKYKVYIDDKKEYSFDEYQKIWVNLVKNDYLQSEGTYFWQIYLNTIHQSLFKDKLLKVVSKSDFFNLISGLDNISHLLPFYDMWAMSRQIIKDKQAFSYWTLSDVKTIAKDYKNKSQIHFIPELTEFINTYGYHSDKELDVTYPCYFEDPGSIIKMLKESILLDESTNPAYDRQKQKQKYLDELAKIRTAVSAKKYGKLVKSIERMRSMLWWREELRDVSTRFYYVIRIYTMELARIYKEKGIISDVTDIWYLKTEDIFDFIGHKKSQADLEKIIMRNRRYYNSFRNFASENEIGAVFDKEAANGNTVSNNITGIGCNSGIVIGTARVIESLAEIDKLRMDDILITKFTDTGWTGKFAILKGIVTEYGGILCHAAIVSREYGIPCVVCVTDAMKLIKDGSTISVNGETGEIIIINEQGG